MDPKFLLAIALTLPLCAQVKITAQGKEKISVEIDGKPFTDFYVGPETAKPYLHPLRTADGKVVTRGFPMVTDIPGEAHDHPHHRGLCGSPTATSTATPSGPTKSRSRARARAKARLCWRGWTSPPAAGNRGPSRPASPGRSRAGKRCSSRAAK